MKKYLETITDEVIFQKPEFASPEKYEPRTTVKAIIKNEDGNIAVITNDVHGLYTLPGGGADSKNLEEEINRESIEEINWDIKNIEELIRVKELRNRDAKEYETVCFTANAKSFHDNDTRTDEEKKNNLRVEWLSEENISYIFARQYESLQKGEIGFYNTAFNVYRDYAFWKEYLGK